MNGRTHMTNEKRRELYQRWSYLIGKIEEFRLEEAVAGAIGNRVFEEYEKVDKELAYDKADQAGWILADEFHDLAVVAEKEASECHKLLKEHEFDLSDFQSCCAYSCNIKKPVLVTFLDGRVIKGLIYPYVYDNPQEMYLRDDHDNTHDLDEGWEVSDVKFLE